MGRKIKVETLKKRKQISNALAVFEKKVADVFGTQRISLKDKVDSETADVSHKELFIRCNQRKEIDVYKWYDKADEESPEDKTPLVVVKSAYKKPLVLMDLNKFFEIYQSRNNDEGLIEEIRKLKKALGKFEGMETVEERRKRIYTHPYVPFGKYAKLPTHLQQSKSAQGDERKNETAQ